MKKQVVVKLDVSVALNEGEYQALQRYLDLPRKPTMKQVKKYFDQVIEDALDELLEEHGPEEEDDQE
jgi:hypothetical protein